MKAIDILKKVEKIENKWILIKEETKTEYGLAVKLTGDPRIKIVNIRKSSRLV